MRRRKFIAVLGGAAAAWPFATRAQLTERRRIVGVLMAAAADDPEYQARIAAFLERLQQLGWADSRNVRVDIRWATDSSDLRRYAAELVELAPDVIVAATGTTTIAPLLQATRSVPIVFVLAIDPVGAGFVTSLSECNSALSSDISRRTKTPPCRCKQRQASVREKTWEHRPANCPAYRRHDRVRLAGDPIHQ